MPAQLWLPTRRRLETWCANMPVLARVLANATRSADQLPGEATLLATAFALPESEVPVAALTRRIDATDDCSGRWLRVDPSFLRVEPAGVRMLACGDLSLSAEEVEALVVAVRPLFDDAGWRFEPAGHGRWYAQPDPVSPKLGGSSPDQALGTYIDSALPQGDAGRSTRRWLNELQMALHGLPINRMRNERGLPEVNSLWLHGDGVAPRTLAAHVDAVVSQDALVLGCAALAGIATESNRYSGRVLVDARTATAADAEAVAALLAARSDINIALASGERFESRAWQRVRFWRKAWT